MKLKAYSGSTQQGPYLVVNEDTYEIDLINDLYMIFDGFGGAGIGDRCVETLKENIKTFYTRVNGNPDATLPFYFSHKYLLEGNALINSMYYAHRALCKENQKLPMGKRGGSSAIVSALSENILTLASVGNCTSYLYRKGKLLKLFQEDSLRLLCADDFKNYLKSCPLSGFGLFEDIHLEIKEVKIQNGDIILMLTDGAYSRIETDEMKYMIEKVDHSSSMKLNKIFELSNSRGNLDNQSAVILQF